MSNQRIVRHDIEGRIKSEHYFTALDGAYQASGVYPTGSAATALSLVTFCVLVMDNDFTVIGKSCCVSEAMFDAETGRDKARKEAISHAYPLLNFEMRSAAKKEPLLVGIDPCPGCQRGGWCSKPTCGRRVLANSKPEAATGQSAAQPENP